jgi:ribonuclease III
VASLDLIQEKIGVRFKDDKLLRQALTHRSFSNNNNERLEFLGDSVLNLAVATLLFNRYGALTEGDLSRVRSNLVKQQTLVEIAQKLELGQFMLLGDGELKSGGLRRPSILADAFEALLGAVFLEHGPVVAHHLVSRLFTPILDTVDPYTLGKDAKTLLQEHLQGLKLSLPVYAVVATHGAAHNQVFEVQCSVPKLNIEVLGSGGSRRAAEQVAAKLALDQVQAIKPAQTKVRSRKAKTTTPAALIQANGTAAQTAAITPTKANPTSGSGALSQSVVQS